MCLDSPAFLRSHCNHSMLMPPPGDPKALGQLPALRHGRRWLHGAAAVASYVQQVGIVIKTTSSCSLSQDLSRGRLMLVLCNNAVLRPGAWLAGPSNDPADRVVWRAEPWAHRQPAASSSRFDMCVPTGPTERVSANC